MNVISRLFSLMPALFGYYLSIFLVQYNTHHIKELVQVVKKLFNKYPMKKVNYIFLTMQLCIREIVKMGGSNNYKISYINNVALERLDNLPYEIIYNLALEENVRNILV